jgi:hypothetical protein
MNLPEFRHSLHDDKPPAGLSPFAEALWYDAKGDWEKAHALVQDVAGEEAAWIHAYLHRKEGDTPNADYWYNRAGRKRPGVSLENEWSSLLEAFL